MFHNLTKTIMKTFPLRLTQTLRLALASLILVLSAPLLGQQSTPVSGGGSILGDLLGGSGSNSTPVPGGSSGGNVCYPPGANVNPLNPGGSPSLCEGSGPASQGNGSGTEQGAGNPINLINGNKYQKETDLAALPGVLGLEIVRHYNSRYAQIYAPGLMGRGWRLSYETTLHPHQQTVQILQADGALITFNRDPKHPARIVAQDPDRGHLVLRRGVQGEEYTWEWTRGEHAGRRLHFNHRGKLTQIEEASGEILTLHYDLQGHLLRVADPQGRVLHLHYAKRDAAAPSTFLGITAIDTPVGRYTYAYGDEQGRRIPPARPRLSNYDKNKHDNADAPLSEQDRRQQRRRIANLIRADWPAFTGTSGAGRRYHYEDPHHPNLLTGISQQSVDGQPQRLSNYAYNGQGNAIASAPSDDADPGIRIREWTPPRAGKPGVTVLEDHAGRETKYTHTVIAGENRLLEAQGPGCATCGPGNTRYRYNKQGQLQETTRMDNAGRPLDGLRKTHDPWGRTVRVERMDYINKAAAHLLIRYEYPVPRKAPDGQMIAGDRPTLIARPSVVAGQEHRIWIAYNARGQITRITETGFQPDINDLAPNGFPAKHAAGIPITRSTAYRYSEINGRSLLSEIDGPLPNGPANTPEDSDITRYAYDKQGHHIVQIDRPGGITHRLQRDGSGRVVNIVFDDGYRRLEYQNAYTPRGVLTGHTRRAWKHSDPNAILSETQRYQVDLFERLIAAQAADGSVQHLAYDEQDRLSGYTAPGGERIAWRYDRQNRPFAQVVFNAQGEVEIARMIVRDNEGRVLATLSPEGVDTFNPVLPVSASGLIPAAERRNGREALQPRIWRDDFGRAVANWNPDDGLMLHRYESNAEGERQTQISLGRQFSPDDLTNAPRWETLSFDPAGRLIRREHPTCSEKLTYEGQLLSQLDSCRSSQHFERDAFGMITGHHQEIGGQHWRETYRYHLGRLIERQTAGGATLYYHYDAAGRLNNVARQSGWANALSGNATGRALTNWLPDSWTQQALQNKLQWAALAAQPSGALYHNGSRWKDTYDKAGRLVQYRLETSAGTVYQARTRWHQDKPVQEQRNGEIHTRRYDPAGRLLPAGLDPDKLEGTPPWLLPVTLWRTEAGTNAAFASFNTTLPATPTRYYTPSGLRTAAWGGANSDNGPERNNWGEQTARHGQQLIWDAEGHLAGVEQNGQQIASYQYDARGMRVRKTLHTVTGNTQTYYLYDTDQRLSAEADASGRVVREYLYNGTRPYAMLEGNKTYAIYSDARGLPLYLLDENQHIVWQGHWDDWGGEVSAPNPTELNLNLRLAGQYHDTESGLYYNIHRYYDPAQGAYLSPDPLGKRPGEHRYAYLNHDPMSGTDPKGLFGIPAKYFSFGTSRTSISSNTIDNGHGDIINAAFALYHQQTGEVRFSRTIIDQIILNNYHTDAKVDSMRGTEAGQDNPLNHFDNTNASGPMFGPDGKTPQGTYANGDNWIQNAVNQINNNRNAYGLAPQSIANNSLYSYNISENLGRLGQNLHTLPDFYAHTNWVDSKSRGGCIKKNGVAVGYVPVGLEQAGLWAGLEPGWAGSTGALYSGTANSNYDMGYGEIKTSTEMYTHAYWNKDDAGSLGGSALITADQKAQIEKDGLYFWQATTFSDANLKKILGDDEKPVFGVNYITDTGEKPKPGERIYVRTVITNEYQLAMALAIEQSIKEIDLFYKEAAPVKLDNGLTLGDVFKMDANTLRANRIFYNNYPNKMRSYEKQ
ncbi:MAG: DUF6531 domain-containing protein [Zoogloeaceae bacterium]|jgi:RHS repeat-associated protein|nr:DUF6531 domain-containing protein [Zoogloeaceae bacterium]